MSEVQFDPETGEVKGETLAPTGEPKALDDMKPEDFGPGVLEADSGQLSLDIGGEPPTHSVLKLKSPAIPLSGEFEKGDVVQFVVTARVNEIRVKDKLDDGLVTSVERLHIGDIEDWRLA